MTWGIHAQMDTQFCVKIAMLKWPFLFQKLQVTSLLELSGNERLELNCSLLLSKQVSVYDYLPSLLSKVNYYPPLLINKYFPLLFSVQVSYYLPLLIN